MDTTLTRRSFVKWGTATAGAATLVGFTGCAPGEQAGSGSDSQSSAAEKGEWKTGACINNCSCGASRCLLKVYVEDGVPLKIRTDEQSDDPIETPQRRACLRGRSQINNILSPARVKYPMKRKNWSPDNPHGELRGKDEWERISWEEALDYIAQEMKKTIEKYGTRGILCTSSSLVASSHYDPIVILLNALGGAVHHDMSTVSYGSWPVTEQFMTGGLLSSPYPTELAESKLHILFGCNWAANKAGVTPHYLDYAREQGAKIVVIDPWLNQTAQGLADEWIPVRPGTDVAFVLGMAYHQITQGLFDQDYLDKYTVGFDEDHMPEGAPPEENFKDYVLGTYDGEPKTPEWAEAICGVPAGKIRSLAEEIGDTDKVNFFAGQSTTKIPAGEQFAQTFYTFALMHGGIGTQGTYMSYVGLNEGALGRVTSGDIAEVAKKPQNQLIPPNFKLMWYPIPTFSLIEDMNSWEVIDYSECWKSVLAGEYGRDVWPGGKKQIDIHQIYSGGYSNSLNQLPDANSGIEAFRKVDFVWGANPFFDTTRQYSDIVLPVCTWWEMSDLAMGAMPELLLWYDKIIDPFYESKPETYIGEELAKRLDIDPQTILPMVGKKQTYATISGATYTAPGSAESTPLLTISQKDLDELGIEGQPQEGMTAFAELKETGYYKIPHTSGELPVPPYAAFYQDPVANPLKTVSGKFEIYCSALADAINAVGYSTISPIGKWQIGDPEQGQGTQTDDFPLLLWTPHSLRRAHSVNDNVTSLREAFPQECFMSEIDAEARGIKNGDVVLMTSPHGKVLRPAKVLPTLVPGAVALQDGAWIQIDEETGIDLGGNPNVLQAPKASGQASQSWTGTLVQVEKYVGDIKLDSDKYRPIVMPVGVE